MHLNNTPGTHPEYIFVQFAVIDLGLLFTVKNIYIYIFALKMNIPAMAYYSIKTLWTTIILIMC